MTDSSPWRGLLVAGSATVVSVGYLRFAALGDSTTVGIGDPLPDGGWRGWVRLLADGLGAHHDVSLCRLAVSGATVADVRARQLGPALAHRPDLASLAVGMNDTLRSTWDPDRVRTDLHATAGALVAGGATLMTMRWHDHGAVLGLPRVVVRGYSARIAVLNDIYDEVHAVHGGLRLDLAACPEVHDRRSWSIDRFHPSERGHRALARAWAHVLEAAGTPVALPAPDPCGGRAPSWRHDAAWIVGEGAPWLGRRARDLGPWALRRAVAR